MEDSVKEELFRSYLSVFDKVKYSNSNIHGDNLLAGQFSFNGYSFKIHEFSCLSSMESRVWCEVWLKQTERFHLMHSFSDVGVRPLEMLNYQKNNEEQFHLVMRKMVEQILERAVEFIDYYYHCCECWDKAETEKEELIKFLNELLLETTLLVDETNEDECVKIPLSAINQEKAKLLKEIFGKKS